jgi:hypothetical protein
MSRSPHALRATRSMGRTLTAGGVLIAAAAVAGAVLLAAAGGPDAGAALILAPTLILISLPVFVRRARLEDDPALVRLFALALLAKLLGAVVRYYVAFDVYGGVADAAGYHEAGVAISERFRAGVFDTGLDSLSETDFIRFLTGVVYAFIGPTGLGGFLVFSWLGFWGLYLFYRAFVVAVPDGRRSLYGVLVFFLPSLLFWPSSVGKEAWMTLALGVAAYGSARLLSGRMWPGLATAAAGLWLAALVRPHVAGLMALALAGGSLFRRSNAAQRGMAPVGKLAGLAAVAALALVLVLRTDAFLERSAIETGQGVTAVLEQTTERTSIGGSNFAPSILESPLRAPLAAATVLFRPFLFEAHNLPSLAASIETTFLLILFLVRLRWLGAAVRSIRRRPYVAMALAYTALFVLAFSGFANFGLLARERVQLLPLLVVLVCIPALRRRSEEP